MVLLDSDVAKKLCQYGLVTELGQLYQCPTASFAVLPQLRYQLRIGKPQALKKLGSKAAVAEAVALISHCQEIQLGPEAANLILSLQLPGIDTGEQVLFAALLIDTDARLLTGDKRALEALAAVEGAIPAWPRIRALEDAVLRILDIQDFAIVSGKIRDCPDADISLSIAFGRTEPAPLGVVIEGLSSYVSDLVTVTLGLYCSAS